MKLTTHKGKTVQVEDRPFASGGQGAVYRFVGQAQGTVAKIFYHETAEKLAKTKKLERRIQFMVNNSPIKSSRQSIQNTLIWPLELLYRNGDFVGFIMPEAGNPHLPETPAKLTSLCKPQLGRKISSRPEWHKFGRTKGNAIKTRLQLCYNIAKAIHALHSTGAYVVVDLKPDNILINSNGWMSIIDLDSVQISKSGRALFPAEAFTEDYVPPEWQKNHSGITKSLKHETWDRFSYAILAYQLLLGIHPFTASHHRFHTISDLIREGIFPNGKKRYELNVIPDSHYAFAALPKEVQALFIRCFEEGHHSPQLRPALHEWVDTLVEVLQMPPKIHSFRSSTQVRKDSLPVRLSWQVKNAGKVFLNGQRISGGSHYDVSPTHDTTYVLVVENGPKKVTAQVEVKVDRTPPQIAYFQTDKSLLTNSLPATLSWKVHRAQSVKISGVGDVTGRASCSVSPKRDTEYELIATGYFGQVVSQKLKITTSKQPPVIRQFFSNINHREDNSIVVLKWKVDGADKLWLESVGDVSKKQSMQVDPRKDTTYRLKAISYFGIESESQLKITVSKKPPVIKSFKASPYFLHKPQPVQLIWEVENAHSLSLSPGSQVTGNQCTVNPLEDTVYTLKAISLFGAVSQTQLRITTSKEPPKIHLESRRLSIAPNSKTIKLLWETEWAKTIQIEPGIGDVEPSGERELIINSETEFFVVAISPFGVKASHSIKVPFIKKPEYNKTLKNREFKGFHRDYSIKSSKRKWNRK